MRGPYRAKPAPGSIADLVLAYRKSPRVLRWSPLTRKKNDRVLGDFMAVNGRNMVSDLRRGDILRMRDEMAHTPGRTATNFALQWVAGSEIARHCPSRVLGPLPYPHGVTAATPLTPPRTHVSPQHMHRVLIPRRPLP